MGRPRKSEEMSWLKLFFDNAHEIVMQTVISRERGDMIWVTWIQIMIFAAKIFNEKLIIDGRFPVTTELLASLIHRPLDDVAYSLGVLEEVGLISWKEDPVLGKPVMVLTGFEEEVLAEWRKKLESRAKDRERKATEESDQTESQELNEEDHSEKESYGSFRKVKLTQEELTRLREKFPTNWQDRIENLDSYKESTGRDYKSDYATILKWAREDEGKKEADKEKMSQKKGLEKLMSIDF